VRNGTVEAKQANVIAQLTREVISTLDIELRAQKQAKDMGGETDVLVLAPPSVRLVGGSK